MCVTKRKVLHTARQPWRRPCAPPKRMCSTVKRANTRPSTTATPYSRKFILSPRGLAAILASSTVVTFPTAAAVLHRQGLGVALVVGLLPIVPLVLLAAAFVTSYMAISMLATLAMTVRIACGRGDPDRCFDDLFIWITNAPISFLTLTPLKLPARAARPTSLPSLLPPGAPGSARDEDTKIYWDVFRDMMATRPGGVPDVVKADDPITQPIRGRHEKSGTEPRTGSYDRASALSS